MCRTVDLVTIVADGAHSGTYLQLFHARQIIACMDYVLGDSELAVVVDAQAGTYQKTLPLGIANCWQGVGDGHS